MSGNKVWFITGTSSGFGRALADAIEEVGSEQIRQQFDTNVFGVLNVTREALPVLRAQKSGHVVNIGSVVGFSALPALGIYSATKFALEALSEALAGELAAHNIKTTIVEPGPFDTGGVERGAFADNLLPQAYTTTTQVSEFLREFSSTAGDPAKAVRVIIEAVESENPPFRPPLGLPAFEAIEAKLGQVKQEISTWRTRAIKTDFDAAATA